ALYFAAFPGLDWWPVAFIAYVPLVIALIGRDPKQGLWLGWIAGFTMNALGFYWIPGMLARFSGFGWSSCIALSLLFWLYQGLRGGLMGWLLCRAIRRGWPLSLGVTSAFLASEQLFPLLFPWFFAATMHRVPLMMQTADLGGPLLVGLILVAANLVFAEPVLAILRARPVRFRTLLFPLSLVCSAAVYGGLRIPQIDKELARATQIDVGLVQANLGLIGKRRDVDRGLKEHLSLTKQLLSDGLLDLVVWSETSVMRPIAERELAVQVPLAISGKLGVPAIFGAVSYRPVQDARKYQLFNSALATDAQGTVRGRYDKHFLVPFSERIPWGDRYPALYRWSPNSLRISPGDSLEPLPFGDHSVATTICYEDLSPSFVNTMLRRANAGLLVNLSNDAWFGDTLEPHQHSALAKLRAVEQRRFLIRSTNSGISAFIDPVGRTLAQTLPFSQQTLRHRVAWLTEETLYRRVGEWVLWALSILGLVTAWLPRPKRMQHIGTATPT
ncbi:MAG TPA: apolipoprotein N-acyltransferase, partial [Polyangiaceae bacterium]|nr:apolipoprotein N-acyltransferase [Polyangiaceae bacterium]